MLRLRAFNFWLPRLADQLLNSWHRVSFPFAFLVLRRVSPARLFTSLLLVKSQAQKPQSFPFRGKRRGEFTEGASFKIAETLSTTILISALKENPSVPSACAYKFCLLFCQHYFPVTLGREEYLASFTRYMAL